MSLSEISFLRGIVNENDAEKIDLERKNNSLKIGINQEEERFQLAIEVSIRNSDRLNESSQKLTKLDADLDFNSLTLNQLFEGQKQVASSLPIDETVTSFVDKKAELCAVIANSQETVEALQKDIAKITIRARECDTLHFQAEEKKLNALSTSKETSLKSIGEMEQKLDVMISDITQCESRQATLRLEIEVAKSNKDTHFATLQRMQEELALQEASLVTKTEALETYRRESGEKMDELKSAHNLKAKQLGCATDIVTAFQTDKLFHTSKVSELKEKLQQQLQVLEEMSCKIDSHKALLVERMALKDSVLASLQQIRMQIASMPKHDIASDQSSYFEEKVCGLDSEIALIQSTLRQSEELIAVVNRQLNGDEEHPALTPLLQQSANTAAAIETASSALKEVQEQKAVLSETVMGLQHQLESIVTSSRHELLAAKTKDFEDRSAALASQSEQLHLETTEHSITVTSPESGRNYTYLSTLGSSPHNDSQRRLWLKSNLALADKKVEELHKAVSNADNDLLALRGAIAAEKEAAQSRLKNKIKSERLQKYREQLMAEHSARIQKERELLLNEDKTFQLAVQQAQHQVSEQKMQLTADMERVAAQIVNTTQEMQDAEKEKQRAVAETANHRAELDALKKTTQVALSTKKPVPVAIEAVKCQSKAQVANAAVSKKDNTVSQVKAPTTAATKKSTTVTKPVEPVAPQIASVTIRPTRVHASSIPPPPPPLPLSQTSHTIEEEDEDEGHFDQQANEEEEEGDNMSEWMMEDEHYPATSAHSRFGAITATVSRTVSHSKLAHTSSVTNFQSDVNEEEDDEGTADGTIEFEPTALMEDDRFDLNEDEEMADDASNLFEEDTIVGVNDHKRSPKNAPGGGVKLYVATGGKKPAVLSPAPNRQQYVPPYASSSYTTQTKDERKRKVDDYSAALTAARPAGQTALSRKTSNAAADKLDFQVPSPRYVATATAAGANRVMSSGGRGTVTGVPATGVTRSGGGVSSSTGKMRLNMLSRLSRE